ncbi:hypothetical protein BDR05DRAFT_969584 [Suillus weaverae]|nr:hypothetical protein BDR05DRAFT_969584 [Suillus weaverae]
MLASIIYLFTPLSLAELQDLFYADKRSLAMMLEAFSPAVLNDGVGRVEIYHASLRDFMINPLRSKQYHIDYAHAHEHLACCCLDFITRQDSIRTRAILASQPDYPYPYDWWILHLYRGYPSSKLRNLLSLFADKPLRHWIQAPDIDNFELAVGVRNARNTCLSLVIVLNMLNY